MQQECGKNDDPGNGSENKDDGEVGDRRNTKSAYPPF